MEHVFDLTAWLSSAGNDKGDYCFCCDDGDDDDDDDDHENTCFEDSEAYTSFKNAITRGLTKCGASS